MKRSQARPGKQMKIIMGSIIAIELLICGVILLQIDGISRRVEALPFYAQTYLNKLRPQPTLPPPPAVSAVDSETLLQSHPAEISALSPTVVPVAFVQAGQPPPAPPPAAGDQVNEPPSAGSESHPQLATETPLPAQPADSLAAIRPIAPSSHLTGFTHEWQTWNNCGPVTIAMNLSYFGLTHTQVEAATFLKPNQNDKNVNPEELAAYARLQGFETFIGVGGDLALLKQLLSNNFPVIVETWLDPDDNGGLGHYRLVTGYDETQGIFNTFDSLQGANRQVNFAELDSFWRVFNRKYVLVYQPHQAALVQAILGYRLDGRAMVEQALLTAQNEAKANPADGYAWFNIGTNYAYLSRPQLAAAAFDEARRVGLPYRMLWYQFEIFKSYLAVGRHQEVVDLAGATLKATGGLEELYYYRGLAYRVLNQPQSAEKDFRAALSYNANFTPATEALTE